MSVDIQGTVNDVREIQEQLLKDYEYYGSKNTGMVSKATQAILDLIEETCNEAREDELEKAVQQFIFNTKSNPHNFSEYAHARLKQLMGGK